MKSMSFMRKNSSGFTIVELLIVIVVIAILAAITIVAYNGIQERARDTQRSSDISTIRKALELYKVSNGQYPTASGTQTSLGGWENSTDPAGTFMEYLSPSTISKVPVDPINMYSKGYSYWYYRYPAGWSSCDPSRGAFYVLRVRFENASSAPASQVPTCASGHWGENYIFISFEN